MAHCVNKSHPDFLKLADATNINPIVLAAKISLWQEKNGLDKFPSVQELNIIKPGVAELFDSNPELANIGTQEQYSQYLDTIFPNSKVKDIVYHGSYSSNIEKFDKSFIGVTSGNDEGTFHFTVDKSIASDKYVGYGRKGAKDGKVYSAVLNIKQPNDTQPNYDGSLMYGEDKELYVYEPEQIHILGGKQDIEGFKKFVDGKNNVQSKVAPSSNFVIQNNGMFLNKTEEEKKQIFENYVNLMDRKREGKSITFEKFNQMFENLQVFSYKNTYIFGEWDDKNNVFKGRLMSSPNIKELYGALDVLFANVDFVASVPSDIGSMLERKGLYKLNVGKEYNFRGEEMVKNLYFSSKELVEKIFKTSPEKVTLEQVKKYDTFFNYWSLIFNLKKAYENKKYNELLPLLKKIGIYDFNAYKLVKKIKQGKITDADTESIVKEIIKNSSNNKVNIDKTDLLNNPKIYNELNNDLNKTLATYLSKFGIKTEALEDMQNKLNIDSFAHVDILNKILYVDKNNQENYPQQAGKLIAFMMQHNPLMQEVTSKMKKLSIFSKLSNDELFEAVGDLISEQLYNKTNTELPKDLLESIKNLIRQFFNYLNNIQMARINKNIGFIADNILIQNQSLITQSVYKPGSVGKEVSKISLEEALKSDAFGNSIVENMAKYFILTGSITLSEQGTVYRPNENQIHDLDWVSSLPRTASIRIFNELYPNNKYIRNIYNKEYQTDTWLIAPEGYEIKNLKIDNSKGTNKITGYDIVDSNNNIVSSYIPISDSHTGEIEAKLIDIFSYDKITEERTANKEITLESGTKLRIADWRNTFAAKLEFGRLKDIWDYNRFIPNDNVYTETKTSDVIAKKNTEENKEEIYLQKEKQSEEKANKEINNLVTNFLEKLGVSVNSVNEIRDAQGNVISAVAKADMLNKIIDIVEGRADITTLPEEAAHFFVEMLGDNNPLFKDMMSKITSYKIYQETVEQYRNNSQYRNKDGSLNINKLKKEAIGKLISQHIVKNSSNETNANLKTFDSWWSKLWNLIKSIFNKSQTDPFKIAAEKILKADISDLSEDNMTETGEYYQLSGIDKLKQHQKDITLDNSIDLKTGQKRHVYTINGKDIKSSVTSKYVDAWLKRKYPTDNRSETQKKLDLVKAEYGDIVHKIMEDILDSYVDPETNLVRPVPIQSVNKNSDSAPYKMLEKYVVDLIAEYNKPGTLFMKEVKIYDPVKDVAGSIDLLIITPTGEASIYDWKSQEIGKDQTELKPYKEIISRIQLQEYKKILEAHYGIKEFNLVRAIPIKTSFKYKGSGTSRVIDSLTSLEIGNFDPSLIPDTKNYLLPITLRDEKTDDKELSSYIKKLNSVMDILENKKYKTDEERKRKKLELNKYKNAVRDLQLRGDVRKFIELGNFEINKYKKMISDNAILPKDALESLEILKLFSNTTNVFNLYMNKLKKIKKDTNDKNVINAVDQIINDYNQMNSTADVVLNDMQNAIKEMASKFAQQKTGITDLLEPETDIDTLSATFNSLSTIDKKAFRVFSRMLGDAQNKRDNLFNKDFEELIALKKEYTEWAKSKGLSDKDLFKPLLNYNDKNEWTGAFVKKYQSEFYDKMKEAIQSDNVKWLIDNTEFDQEKFDKSKIRQKEFYDSLVYDSKDKENNKKLQKQAYETWLLNHDVNIGGLNKNKQAYLNMDNYNGKKTLNSYLKPKEKWFSKQWKELSSNPVALKTYNYFQDLLKRSAKAGVIDEYSPAFIPNIFRNKLEQFVFGGDTFSKKGFFESFEVESGESPYAPQINPITGAIEHSIPTHFIRDIGVEREDGSIDYSQKSMDLFRVFGVWSAQLANYEAMSEIEDEAKILLFAENNKKHIETDNFNNPVFEGGVLKEIPGNKINSELLETFMNFYFYNKQSGKIEDKKIKIGDKEYSGSKAVGWLVRFFSLKTLALNPLSGTANFVGGTGNAFFQASKGILFNTSDWASSMYDVTKRDEIAWGLLGISDVLIEDQKDSKLNKLSVSKVINANTIDKAFVLMRASDRAVQYPVAIALMKNNMVDENGKIVDIQTYVKAKYKYNEEFYKLPKPEQNIIRKKIEEEVTQLKENKSIYKTAKIVNDKIEIPGVDLNSEAWGRFRLKIKKVNKSILGNSSRDDINRIKTNMLGSMAMQFRSWMPQMIQERFGKLKYDQDLEVHTIGKFNLWISELFSKRAVSLLSGIISSSGTNMIEAAREKYLILKAEAIDKGEEFTITEGEFVDLYIGNIRSMYREFLVILGIGALIFTALSGDDDDEDEDKGWKTYAGRAFRKYFDEFAFFYSAPSWSNLVNKPLPIVGLAEDFWKFTGATFSQSYGFILNDEDIMEDAKPAKYLSKMMPIFKEGIQMRAIFDEDFRKDWDIRFNASNR